jgi:MOSC domain-containing protein YiiM
MINNNEGIAEKGSIIPESKHIGYVAGVAIGKERGTSKKKVPHIDLKEGSGILGDGHAYTEKQVSLVAVEEIDRMNMSYNIQARIGDFAENIATRGIDLMYFSPGDQIRVGAAVLKVVRLGKSREEMRGHTFSFKGYTLLPEKGLFCEVIKDGRVSTGDEIWVISKR